MSLFKLVMISAVAASLLTGCGSLNPFGNRNADAGPVAQAARVKAGAVVAVNRHLWNASLEVLSFLPIQSVDPFTGVIVFGYGTPPGGSKAYRATVLISSPALDASSLNVALASRSGPVSQSTAAAVEDAILTRARQMRSGQ